MGWHGRSWPTRTREWEPFLRWLRHPDTPTSHLGLEESAANDIGGEGVDPRDEPRRRKNCAQRGVCLEVRGGRVEVASLMLCHAKGPTRPPSTHFLTHEKERGEKVRLRVAPHLGRF